RGKSIQRQIGGRAVKNLSETGHSRGGRRFVAVAALIAALLVASVALLRLFGGTAPVHDPDSLSAGHAEPRQAFPDTPPAPSEDDLPPDGTDEAPDIAGTVGETPAEPDDLEPEAAGEPAPGFV